MKVLLTGASSFTGSWIVRELVASGHDVVATFQKTRDGYTDLTGRRVDSVLEVANPIWNCSFGDDKFLEVVSSTTWDAFCHHGADVRDYRNTEFDIGRAVESNTHRITAVYDSLSSVACDAVLVTGSVFEGGEGAGSGDGQAFSPYGLSKELSYRVFEYLAHLQGKKLGKFVIPNPFGPLEEPRFTAYLARCWLEGRTAMVNTPDYVRDNIHVDLLAKAYVDFLELLVDGDRLIRRTNPSGYVESQGDFASRFATQMRQRTGDDCALELRVQTDFSEPMNRHNTNPVENLDWSEAHAWDRIAEFYWWAKS